MVVVLLVTGGLSIAGRIVDWVRPAPAVAAPPTVADVAYVGTATVAAVDYLSWDATDKAARQTALGRVAAANVTVDGWDGNGRQWADSAAVLGLVRGPGTTAVATVRVRVIPFVAAGNPPSTTPPPSDAGRNVAAGPDLSRQGWAAQPARWATVAVPLAEQAGHLVMTSSPALMGSAPTSAAPPAVAPGSGSGDGAFATATKGTVTDLLRSWGAGALAYSRASGTSFTGLDGAAALDSVSAWQTSPGGTGDGATRVGDATVTWKLSGNAGALTCGYRVSLRNQEGRWYLAAVSAETEATN